MQSNYIFENSVLHLFIHFLTIIIDVSNKYKCPISCTKYNDKHILNRDSTGLMFWVYIHLVTIILSRMIRNYINWTNMFGVYSYRVHFFSPLVSDSLTHQKAESCPSSPRPHILQSTLTLHSVISHFQQSPSSLTRVINCDYYF